MDVTKASLRLLREIQTTSEESDCMKDYCEVITELETMKRELNSIEDKSSKLFKVKKKRLDIISNASNSFYKSYFSMCKYKEMYVMNKQKLLEKEMEFLDLICS